MRLLLSPAVQVRSSISVVYITALVVRFRFRLVVVKPRDTMLTKREEGAGRGKTRKTKKPKVHATDGGDAFTHSVKTFAVAAVVVQA